MTFIKRLVKQAAMVMVFAGGVVAMGAAVAEDIDYGKPGMLSSW